MTAGEFQFNNGIVGRHNNTLLEAFSKTLEDVSCAPELAWALSAKNGLQKSSDFTPNQLVFGYLANTPTVLTNKLPVLQAATSSEIGKI